jgi:hypothetical protein
MSCQTCRRRIRGVKVIVCDRDGGTRHYHGVCAATLHDVPEMTTDGRAVLARFIDDWNAHGRGYAVRAIHRGMRQMQRERREREARVES